MSLPNSSPRLRSLQAFKLQAQREVYMVASYMLTAATLLLQQTISISIAAELGIRLWSPAHRLSHVSIPSNTYRDTALFQQV